MPGEKYTERELSALNLPGYNSPLTLTMTELVNTDWQPLFNAAVIFIDDSPARRPPQILTAIRTIEGNDTHPNVISTLTRRMYDKQKILELLYETKFTYSAGGILQSHLVSKYLTVAQATPHIRSLHDDSALAFFTRSLFKDKVDLGKIVAAGEGFPGTLSLGPVLLGFAGLPENNAFQPMIVFGGIIKVIDQSIFPIETEDYRKISWSPLLSFTTNVVNKNVKGLIPTATNMETTIAVCVHGQCLATSMLSIENPELLADHLSIPVDRLNKQCGTFQVESAIGPWV